MTDLLYRKPWLGLLFAILVYSSLILPTVIEHGVGNDELIDMKIAMTYLTDEWGWLGDSDLDASQTRLTMYATALANLFLGTQSLIVSRLLSVVCGMITLVLVYWFCARELNPLKGVLAVSLLAMSAYFLAFSRVAMTEGDAWVPMAGMGLALATVHLARNPTVGAACAAALVSGLVISTKFTTLIWLPAAFLAFLVLGRRVPSQAPASWTPWLLLLPLLAGLLAVVFGWWYLSPRDLFHLDQPYAEQAPSYLVRHALSVGGAWILFVAAGVYWRRQPAGRFTVTCIAGLGAALTFFIVPPVHTTNPGVVEELATAFMQNRGGLPDGIRYSSFVLHFLVILLKSGPAMGLLFLGSAVAALWTVRRRPVLVVPLLFTAFYFAFYVFMGRGQTFYMMGILPFLAILAADALGETLKRSRLVFAAVFGLVSLNAAADLARTYPDMHLNGYQWLGERFIAHRSTLGYKSVVQTPSDGTVQVIDWARRHVEPRKWVVTYLRERLAIYYLGPASGVRFTARSGFGRFTIDNADYVLLHINATLRQFQSSTRPLAVEARKHTTDRSSLRSSDTDSIYVYPFDKQKLEREFEKVYSVRRAFGIEVASVWRRKPGSRRR